MSEASTVLDRKGEMFNQLLSAVRSVTPSMVDSLKREITVARDDCDISPSEADDLQRILTARMEGDDETASSLLLKDGPGVLSQAQRNQAEIDHQFRVANQCAHRCSNLRWNAHERYAQCTDPAAKEACTKACPALEKKTATESAQMVA